VSSSSEGAHEAKFNTRASEMKTLKKKKKKEKHIKGPCHSLRLKRDTHEPNAPSA